MQLAAIRDGLRVELGDLNDALKGEQEAREAATEELHARLAAKERAEEEKEAAQAKFLNVERQYLSKVDELMSARDAANAEVRLCAHVRIRIAVPPCCLAWQAVVSVLATAGPTAARLSGYSYSGNQSCGAVQSVQGDAAAV